MRNRVGMTDTMALASQTEADIARAVSSAMRRGTDLLKDDWRDQIESSGLGAKLAKTVQGRTYPPTGDSLDPATWVFTKAPVIVDAYDRGPLILPTSAGFHRYLAIPTDKVPRKGRRRMTPVEVEATFNQDLIIHRNKRGTILAFVDVTLKPVGRGARRRRRIGKPKLVLMFILVQWVKVKARFSLQAIAGRAQARYPGLLAEAWVGIPDRTARMKGL